MLCRPFVGSFYLGKQTPLNLEAPVEKGEYVLRKLWAYTRLDSFLFFFVVSFSFIGQALLRSPRVDLTIGIYMFT